MPSHHQNPLPSLIRRRLFTTLPVSVMLLGAGLVPLRLFAEETEVQEAPQPAAPAAGTPFSFDLLSEMMRLKAQAPYTPVAAASGFLDDLGYDDYQRIAYLGARAKWNTPESLFRVHAFHMGWLFKEPVLIHEVADGMAREITFNTDDFEYRHGLSERVPQHVDMPGVAGLRLHYPLNRPDVLDELVAFVGASYFRALGRDNSYGVSARGLAINTGLPEGEEFPRFTDFYLERPAPGAKHVVLHAAMDSPSVTGAYRFVIHPGEETVMDVTARLFFRQDVKQLGVAPLTSMFLYAQANRAGFDDYRPQVHDSDGLLIRRGDGDVLWRALNNPKRLASSYFHERGLQSFGLYQRDRDFGNFQDAGARYEARPSVRVEPVGDWGPGAVRLVEIPSDLEVNDNIVAFWVPDTPVKAGETREFNYRLSWGMLPPDTASEYAYVHETRAGHGGVSGVKPVEGTRKFVVDFKGGLLGRMPADADVAPVVSVSNATVQTTVLSKIDGTDIWRLALDVAPNGSGTVELVAHIAGHGRKLSEVWLYQWTGA